MLLAFGVKLVRLLAITLSIAVRCNTANRPESIHYALMTRGQVFVCYPATILSIATLILDKSWSHPLD